MISPRKVGSKVNQIDPAATRRVGQIINALVEVGSHGNSALTAEVAGRLSFRATAEYEWQRQTLTHSLRGFGRVMAERTARHD